jgi:hypothetical protein
MSFDSMKNPFQQSSFFLLGLLFILPIISIADDVGLITAKLTEYDGFEYVLEADVTPQLQNTLFKPSLPEGFKRRKTEYSQRGALINVRYPFVGNRTLESSDSLNLPWNRSGVLLHAKWADGTQGSDLFLRTTEGIPVGIDRIKTSSVNRWKQIKTSFRAGLNLVSTNWKLWIPVLSIVLLFSAPRAANYLWMLTAGITLSLLIPDLYSLEITPAMSTLLILVAVLMAARLPDGKLSPVFIAAATALGLSSTTELSPEPRMAFGLGLILFYGGVGALLLSLRKVFCKTPSPRWVAVVLGGLAVAGLIQTITTPAMQERSNTPTPVLSSIQQPAVKTTAKQTPRKLTDPFVAFLSIEPYEVRFEIMASGKAITQLLNNPLAQSDLISIEEQPVLKKEALQTLGNMFAISFDGNPAEPSLQRSDFLTLGTAGAFTRTTEVPEPLEDAIIGLTFAYIRPGPPQTIDVAWNDLPLENTIPATIIEPAGNQGFTFSSSQLSLRWKMSPTNFSRSKSKWST